MRWPVRLSCNTAAALLTILIACSRAPAEEDSRLGWMQFLGSNAKVLFDPPKRGEWDIRDNRVTIPHGEKLMTSRSLRLKECELTFTWEGAEKTGLRVLIPGADLFLQEGEPVEASADSEKRKEHRTKGKIAETGKPHKTTIRSFGDSLFVNVDELSLEFPFEQPKDDPLARNQLFWWATGSDVTIANLRIHERPGDSLLSGDTLEGWWTPGNLNSWKIEQGELVCLNQDGNYLRSEKEYENFVLSLEYTIPKRGNSGIGIRTPRNGWPSGDGMELQIEDEPTGTPLTRSSTMGIYGNLEPLARADRSEEWNEVLIRADGPKITAFVNGVLVQHANTDQLPELHRRHRKGWIGFQDHGAAIRFRNMRLRELPASLNPGLAARNLRLQDDLDVYGKQEHDPRGLWRYWDRLMNPQIHLFERRLQSHASTIHCAGPGPHVLLDLSGPGIVTRIARTSDSGRLSFFFDYEDQPRLDVQAAELASQLLRASDDVNPILTSIPFRTGLKIVLKDPDVATDYRIDFIGTPRKRKPTWGSSDATSQSFAADIPRGMLPALSYRREQLGWGVHREHDPTPRVRGETQDVAPSKRSNLVQVDGQGIVEWFKLHIDKAALANDDLWLEVFVDGGDQPSVAAPARYLFAGLQNAENAQNFVWTYRDGFTCFLPIPYTAGLRIVAVNHGQQPLHGIAMTLSMDQRDAKTRLPVPPYRLMGKFLPATTTSDAPLIEQAGSGEWIGFIYAPPSGGETGLAALEVDGQEHPGWASPNMDLFFGSSGKETDVRQVLSGRRGGLAWSWLHLAPVWFDKSIVLKARDGDPIGDRLALFYLKK